MKVTLEVKYDCILKEYIRKEISRNFYGFLKEHKGKFVLNGEEIKPYCEVLKGQVINISYENRIPEGAYSKEEICVIYEDDDLIVIDKPAHLQTIPSRKSFTDSLFNRLLYYFKDKPYSCHFINRLDSETRGLVLVAKNPYMADLLSKTKIDKTYYAKTTKPLEKKQGTFNGPIGRIDGVKRGVLPDGQIAITHYRILEEMGPCVYEVNLETGRTHQIRVHFSNEGTPLVNDWLYGDTKGELGLVCAKISFVHPLLQKELSFKSHYNL